MSTIVSLKTNGQEVDVKQICPNEIATIEATTNDGELVTWTVDGSPLSDPTPDNKITIKPASGQSIDVKAEIDGTSRAVTLTGMTADAVIEVDPGPYAISAEPKMPTNINARGVGISGVLAIFQWNGHIVFRPDDYCWPNVGPPGLVTFYEIEMAATAEQVAIGAGDVVRGGILGLDIEGAVNDCPVRPIGSTTILGTNPERVDIRAALPHDALRGICSQESGCRQFDAPPDGGIGRCPVFGNDGGVGVMGVVNPTDDEVWNWRANVARGIELFNERLDAAAGYPERVRNSPGFEELVASFNQVRLGQGLAAIQIVVPDFTAGNLDSDLRQLERDAIRGYDGWFGTDRFGFEMHEYQIAVDRVNGEEILRVNNIDLQAGTGEAEWETVPRSSRAQLAGDPDYCEGVVAFLLGCPEVTVDVDVTDSQTHKIPSKLAAGSGRTHFVTVKGFDDVILVASITPDTPLTRKRLTWEADGATITLSPNDPLIARISRNTTTGLKVPGRIKLGTQVAVEFVVWIIWCTLKAEIRTDHISTLTGDTLGLGQLFPSEPLNPSYYPCATIEWTASIQPSSIINDIDRPAIEDQVRSPDTESGVPGPTDHDMTGSDFRGWDMSRQKRSKVFKANPNETLKPDSSPDPEFPDSHVKGNDDSRPGVEDDNPYDFAIGPETLHPGHGKKGELRAYDRPARELLHSQDQNGHTIPPTPDGHRYQIRLHFREFVRVQLGSQWYRCSEWGLWRWHMYAIRKNGTWQADPADQDILDLKNEGYDTPPHD